MKVLILHQHFKHPAQGGAIRSYYLAKALKSRGHDVHVITGHNGSTYALEQVEGINIHYLPVAYDNRFGFARRSFSFLKFILTALAGKFYSQVDVIYAISVPVTIGLIAIWIKKRRGIPFIFEVGDLWPAAPIQIGAVRNFFLKKILFGLESKIYREAHSIVALSSAIRQDIEERFQNLKIHVIPNMADTDFYKPEPKEPVLEEKFDVAGKFVISYIGAMGLANGLDYLLQCAKASQEENLPVSFLLCGDGARLESMKETARHLHLQNLAFVPFRNREGVKKVMNVSDAVFVCYKPLPILETGSPNKYFDGLSAGKLIIINFGGWIKNEIEKNGCGVHVNAHEPSDFANKIKPFIVNQALLQKHQLAARRLAEKSYSRERLTEKFVNIIESFHKK